MVAAETLKGDEAAAISKSLGESKLLSVVEQKGVGHCPEVLSVGNVPASR